MIKAYHQVGSDEWDDAARRDVLHDVLAQGRIEPASVRMDRWEMEIECFTGKERGSTLKQRFPRAKGNAWKALQEIARERVAALPETGVTHGLFNCLDLIAGDFDLIFLKPGNWYSIDNGFVFDAQELIKKGARFRRTDLLGGFHAAIAGALSDTYDSVGAAKESVELEIQAILDHFQTSGRSALRAMKDGMTDSSEIVWRGPLPLDLAIEVWENGKNITSEVKK